MTHRTSLKIALLTLVLFLLAACAPDDLDITPTVAPSPAPTIKVYVTGAVQNAGNVLEVPVGSRAQDAITAAGGATDKADLQRVNMAEILFDGETVHVPEIGETFVEATQEAVPSATPVVDTSQALVDYIVSTIPDEIDAGVITWQKDNKTPVDYLTPPGGVIARMAFDESGGGNMELSYGIFDTPQNASAYYQRIYDSLNSQHKLESRDAFPTPNAFGSGTYGSDALFVRDNIYIRVSVPKFSGSAGDPLNPMGKQALDLLDKALASYTGPK